MNTSRQIVAGKRMNGNKKRCPHSRYHLCGAVKHDQRKVKDHPNKKNCRLVTSQQPLISIQKLCFYENYKQQTQVYLNSPPCRFPYHVRHLHPHQTQGGNYHSENVCASLPNSRSPARYTNCWSCLKNNSSRSSLCAQE